MHCIPWGVVGARGRVRTGCTAGWTTVRAKCGAVSPLPLFGADPAVSCAQGLQWGEAAGASCWERRGMERAGGHREDEGSHARVHSAAAASLVV